MKISIIVPVYNVEKYVEKCINSLLNQTLDDIEIIIVNDGSTDKSKDIILKYLSYKKIKYFEKQNGGLASARNYGLQIASGEYIAFLDSDDYVENDMYEKLYNKAKKEDADMVECDFWWEYPTYKKIDKRKKYKTKEDMLKRPRVVVWNKLYKKSIIDENKIRFPEGLIFEDLEFFFKFMYYATKISYIPEPKVHYVQRENSILSSGNKNEDIFKILNNIEVFFYSKNKYLKEINYMKKRILLGSSLKRIIKIKDINLKARLLKQTFKQLVDKPKANKKIVFGITSLGLGGAERVLVDMANKLCSEYKITIFTIYSGGELENELRKEIKLESLFKEKNKLTPLYFFVFGKFLYNKKIRGKYNVEVAFLEGPITRMFCFKGNAKKIAWVHNDISKVFGTGAKATLKKHIDKNVYKKYDKIFFVSEDNKLVFNKIYKLPQEKQDVIYNYIDKNRVLEKAEDKVEITKEKNIPMILSIARLTKQKGIDRFIKIHKKLIDNNIFHKVYVIGDGEEREELEKLIKELKLQDSFILLGKKENPYPYIKIADYLALLSYYEGYGMVIEEAKILDKNIIITNTAAVEAVKKYKKCWIIENNEKSIFEGLKTILEKR